MSIKVGESNKTLDIDADFDISGFTDLTITLTAPSLAVKTFSNSVGARVTAPGTTSAGSIPANEYFQLITIATDFDEAGTWTVCGKYTDTGTTPDSIWSGDDVTFIVGAAC
jgi:hypothetical protein